MAEANKFSLDLKLIIVGLAILLMVGGVAFGVAQFVVVKLGTAQTGNAGTANQEARKPGIMTEVGEFTTNLADPGGKRFLKIRIWLEAADNKFVNELNNNNLMPVARDRILTVLSSKTVEDLSASDGKDKLKKEILTALNKQFGGDKFLSVYFSDVVYQ